MTLRNRVLIAMGLVALVLVGAGVLILRVTTAYLVERVDAQLEGLVPRLDDDRMVPPARPPPDAAESPGFRSAYTARIDADGTFEYQMLPNLTEGATVPGLDPARAQAAAAADDPPFTVAGSGDAPAYRFLARSEPGTGDTLVVGLSLADVEAAGERLAVVEVVAGGVMLGVLALVTVWVVRLGVRPIKRMTATATAIAGGDLSHRAEPSHPGTEAADLADALNTMLGRIETAFEERAASEARLRRFVADASHELRTPVTAIRGYADLYRHGGLRQPGELDPAMRRVEQEAVRMGRLVDDLALLARLDQGRPLDAAPVDLALLAADAARDAGAMAPERAVTLDAAEPVLVTGDDHRLRQVVGNLVANALVHTPPDAAVRISAARQNGHGRLEVADDGPGMAPQVAGQAFERFWRADPARARSRGGSGLGLAIAKAIVEAHHGSVALRTAPGRGTTVTVDLPLASTEEHPPPP